MAELLVGITTATSSVTTSIHYRRLESTSAVISVLLTLAALILHTILIALEALLLTTSIAVLEGRFVI